jgi:hypothetical protein
MAILTTPMGPLQIGTMAVVIAFSLGWFLIGLQMIRLNTAR